jgi:hypothetical protein
MHAASWHMLTAQFWPELRHFWLSKGTNPTKTSHQYTRNNTTTKPFSSLNL